MNKKLFEEWKIAVIGAGTMGTNIAFHMAEKGYEVNLCDTNAEALEKSIKQMKSNVRTLGECDGVTDKKLDEIIGRVHTFTDMAAAVKGVPFVIEAVFENVEVKKGVFEQLADLCDESTILASNTSTLNIFDFVDVKNMDRVIITHFNGPAYITRSVEIVYGPKTSEETIDICVKFLESVDKVCIKTKPIPGFIINRLNMALLREFCYMVEQGWANPGDIDAAVAAHYGVRTAFEGIFGQADHSGLDITKNIAELLGHELCSSPISAGNFIQKYVDKGWLGVKTKKGFFDYDSVEEARWERDTRILLMLDKIKEVNAKCDAWKAEQD